MSIYINLEELLLKKGMKAIELSKVANLTPEHISLIKNWKTTKIELATIEKLLRHLDAEPNDLFKYTTE